MIIVRTPLRVSFFGGGTDHPSWYRQGEPGAVLSTSIDKYIYIQLRRLPAVFDFNYRVVWNRVEQVRAVSDIQHPIVRTVLGAYAADEPHGFEVVYNADLPARSGLGSSSAFTVAMLHATLGNMERLVSKSYLAREAIRIEQDLLHEPVGSQDQVAAAHGGLNRIDFGADDSISVAPLAVSRARKHALQDQLLMLFTGFTREASGVEKQKIENFAQRRMELHRMYQMVAEGAAILADEKQDLSAFGRLLHEAWTAKRSLTTAVSNSAIDDAYAAAMAAGAFGGKLLGAGGGGFLLFMAPPERHAAVRAALPGMASVPIRFDEQGSSVVLYNPELSDNYECAPAALQA